MSVQTITDAEALVALRLYAQHDGNVSKAAANSDRSYTTFRRHLAAAKERNLTLDAPVLSNEDKLRIALQRVKRDYAGLQRETDTAERIRQEVYGLAARTPEPPTWLVKHSATVGDRGVPMVLWSDWHFGEVVRPEEVGGLNEFNSEIAKHRIEKLVDITIDLCERHMGQGEQQWPGIVVCLGGDMISGDIHEELFVTNDRTTQQSINDLTDILAAALERMADTFGRVFVPCVVGNHGRASRKPRMKGRVYTSHEWNIYTNLERYFRKDKRVQFMIPEGSDAYFKVFGYRFLLTHGDSLGVKGGDGIIGAIGPIMRGSLKVGRSEAQVGRDADWILMGHWHQMFWLPGVIVNGALKGYDEFARLALRAPYSRPSQALWFVHPEHGVTAKWEIFLDKEKGRIKSPWLEWQES